MVQHISQIIVLEIPDSAEMNKKAEGGSIIEKNQQPNRLDSVPTFYCIIQ
jgi:hypothetical protein